MYITCNLILVNYILHTQHIECLYTHRTHTVLRRSPNINVRFVPFHVNPDPSALPRIMLLNGMLESLCPAATQVWRKRWSPKTPKSRMQKL